MRVWYPFALGAEPGKDIRVQTQCNLPLRLDGPQPLAYHRAGELLRRRLGDIGLIDVRVAKIAEVLPISFRGQRSNVRRLLCRPCGHG